VNYLAVTLHRGDSSVSRTVYSAAMSETPIVNYTEDAVSGFGEPLPGGMPVVPDVTADPPEGGEGEGEGTPEE
jgi:hypothetical protein